MGGDGKARVLQFGASGQVARALTRAIAGRANILHRALAREDADFSDPDQIGACMRAAGPVDLVVNLAAFTAVDRAQSDEALARRVNAESVARLAEVCAERNIPLIHVSTDYVFDGSKPTPYVETDETHPLNIYGRTKLEGENAIRERMTRHIIVRSSWVYSAVGTNFVKTILRLCENQDVLRIVDDQYGAPTSATDLADAILSIVDALVLDGGDPLLFGTFHYASKGETTWCGFAKAIVEEANFQDGRRVQIVPITTAEYPTPARRPLNARLDCSKIEIVYGVRRRPWRQSLAHMMKEILATER